MTDTEKLKAAIDTVARRVLANNIDAQWELYPEIGEFDWVRVVERLDELTASVRPDGKAFKAAYEFLTERAENADV